MKSNITMQSKDRDLFGVVIKQDTKTSFLSVTDLQEAYTRKRIEMGWKEKRIEDVLSNKSNAERIFYILEKQGYIVKTDFTVFMEMVDKESLVKVMKKFNAYKTVGRGENRRTVCDPYIWVLIALELNPMLYAEVVTWLTDKLILNRIEVGNWYNTLSRSVAKLDNPDYKRMARGLNWIVFNDHERNKRNYASNEELKELDYLQHTLVMMIDMGYIKTFDELLKVMRDMYKKKWRSVDIVLSE